jgi:hypothetical protein
MRPAAIRSTVVALYHSPTWTVSVRSIGDRRWRRLSRAFKSTDMGNQRAMSIRRLHDSVSASYLVSEVLSLVFLGSKILFFCASISWSM